MGKFWEESLRKIKAESVSIVSTYVIWIHYEEENQFDFTAKSETADSRIGCLKRLRTE